MQLKPKESREEREGDEVKRAIGLRLLARHSVRGAMIAGHKKHQSFASFAFFARPVPA